MKDNIKELLKRSLEIIDFVICDDTELDELLENGTLHNLAEELTAVLEGEK